MGQNYSRKTLATNTPDIKMDLKKTISDWIKLDSGEAGSIRGGEFLDRLFEYQQLLKELSMKSEQ
jgi:hypothetical protein